MVIRFACTHCGQGYSVADEYWGMEFKCKKCGEKGTVPGQPELEGRAPEEPELELEEETDEELDVQIQTVKCPNCRADVTVDAVLCVNCGLNLRTGLMPGEQPEPEPEPVARPRADMTPLIKPVITGVCALIGLIVVVILFLTLVRPMLTASAMDDTKELAKRGRVIEAAEQFEEMAAKVGDADRPSVERLAGAMRLQAQMMDMDPTSVGDVVLQGYFADVEGTKLQRLAIRALVQNNGSSPVQLHKECFYLWGSYCVSWPEERRDEVWPEVTVAPGEMGEATVRFTAVPGLGIGLAAASPTAPTFVVYNDGVNYTSKAIDLLSILD
jgi:hypothetical protein